MADVAESSSMPYKNEKPVIVRVKRKAFQSPLDAFWLEINERPLKRPLLDFEKLSISESSRKVEELKTKKVFVRHVDTVSSSDVTVDTLRSFVSNSADTFECKVKNKDRRHTFKTENKQDQLLVKAKQQQELLSKNARFEQIWRSRKEKKEAMHDKTVHEMCRLYDVVRVDVEETTSVGQEQEETELEDHRIMCSYLPLLKEFIPSAAAEVESDIHAYMYKRASRDDYVYDFYAVEERVSVTEDTPNQLPLVQVDDDDGFYDGPVESEFESDDSNAEDNPMNDYPDEETSEDEEEVESITSNDESEELDSASTSDKSPEHGDLILQDLSEDSQSLYEDEIYGDDDDDDGDGTAYDYEGGYDDDWR